MLALSSAVEGRHFKLHDLEKKLKPIGYVIGGGWEYEHGFFDYKVDQNEATYFCECHFKQLMVSLIGVA